MHGLGNDFVVIDAINQKVSLTTEQIQWIANRRFGIGCDQILLVEPPINDNADFRYRIFNADGGEVSQCGNGARCFARFLRDKGLCCKDEIVVDTDTGQLGLKFNRDNQITVNMGIPLHQPSQIPLAMEKESIRYTLTAEGTDWQFGAVSIGNPHAVLAVDHSAQAPVKEIGPVLGNHPVFPDRANIGFMEIVDAHHIRLRVFERGSGETLACGSGACAATVVGIEQALLTSPVQVSLLGGSLSVEWEGRGTPVFLNGPAVSIFEGSIDL